MNKVCVVTATRAEYGLLRPLMRRLVAHPELKLQIIATGTHLEQNYGRTVLEIEADGFNIDARVSILAGDGKAAILKTMARALHDVGGALNKLNPEMLVVLGDRYELLPVVSAAAILGLPVAHIHGGETTEGAYDDMFRHAITKMSQLHFAAAEAYRRRIVRMGESPDRVFNVGSLGVENALNMKKLSREEIEGQIGFELGDNTLLVTFHPVTMETNSQEEQFKALLEALEERTGFRVIFTRPNADTGRGGLNKMIDAFAGRNSQRCAAFASLGVQKYLSMMKYCLGVVGNSSSGIIEAPSMRVGTVNIGSRQKGRLRAASIIDCPPEKEAIARALDRLRQPDFKDIIRSAVNPYEGVCPSLSITGRIARYLQSSKAGNQKVFYDLPWN